MNENIVTLKENIPKKAKIAYGSANSASMLISGIGLGAIDVFYLKATGITPGAMAISWIAFIIWNMINDALIGIIQDKTKSEKGRRVPYLRYGAPIYVITFIWIWFPMANTQELLFFNHLLMLFVFDTVYSMMGLIFFSMPAEMALTAKERGNIMIYATALGGIGMLGSIILPLIYLQGDTPNIQGFQTLMILVGIIAGIVIYISSYHIKENNYTQMEESMGFVESIKKTFRNKPFLIFEIAIFASIIMMQVMQSYIIFLFDYAVSFDMNLINVISFALIFCLIAVSVRWLMNNIDKYGLKKLMRAGCAIASIGFLIIMIIGGSSNVTQDNKIPFYIISLPFVLISFGLLAYLLLGQPLMADCIDNDELLTGKRRETTYSGINALITKPAVSLGRFFFLMILIIYGYKTPDDPDADPIPPSEQPIEVATGVILAFTLIPMICLMVGYIALHFFPLDGPEWDEKKRILQEIHIKKELEYIKYLQKKGNIDKEKGQN